MTHRLCDALPPSASANRTVAGTAYNIGYLYDLMGNLTQLTYPSGRKVSYTYTATNELSKVTDVTSTSFEYVTGASYSPLGTIQQLSLANQVSTTLGWNNLARLTSILTQKSASPALLDLGYSYYANSQIQQITNNLDSLKTEKYAYDDLARLLTAQRGPDTNIQRKYSYDYDRFGNRWAQTLLAGSGFGGSNTFDYASNRITSPNFSFDASGNITANGAGTSFTFNPENFMTAAGASIAYSVDTLGRRTKKAVSGVTTNYFYSGSVVITEKQGSTWTDYIFFGEQRIAQQAGSALTTAKFLHQDHLGSTRVCTDGSGNSAGTCDYELFGEFQPGSSCSALPTNYRFAGMEYDSETGLYHTQFRQYDPNQGRWMGVDPLSGSPDNPQSVDRYAYVLDDPVHLTDPLGLETHCALYCTLVWSCQWDDHIRAIVCDWRPDCVTVCTDVGTSGGGGSGGSGGSGGQSGGSGGTGSTDFAARVRCATQFGQNHSLAAGVGAIFGEKVGNNFVTQLLLGNTVSSLAKIGTDIFDGTSPDARQVASMALKGVGQGIPNLPGGIPVTGPVAPVRDAAVGAAVTAGANVIRGVGQETLELGINASGKVATSVGSLAATTAATIVKGANLAKFGFDLATFGVGLIRCW